MTGPGDPVEPTTPIAAGPRGRARLGVYGWWQLRDYLVNKGIGTLLILGLLLFLSWTALRSARAEALMGGEAFDPRPLIELGFLELMNNMILFGVLFATNGIVSEDRKFGYYRFYFSKPVSVAAFYAQKFVVHVMGVLLIAMLILAIHGIVIGPLYPRAYLPVTAAIVVGLAGIGFLVSAVFTLDWISLFAIYAAAQIGWMIYGDDPGLRGVLVRGLPPVHRLREVYGAVIHGAAIPMEPVWWVLAYGLACLLIGLVVISRRRLATS